MSEIGDTIQYKSNINSDTKGNKLLRLYDPNSLLLKKSNSLKYTIVRSVSKSVCVNTEDQHYLILCFIFSTSFFSQFLFLSAAVFPSMRTEKPIITFNQCPARNVMVCAPVSSHRIPSQSSSFHKKDSIVSICFSNTTFPFGKIGLNVFITRLQTG